MGHHKHGHPGGFEQMDNQVKWSVLKRLFSVVWENYKFSCLTVFVCIIASALISLCSTLFMKTLIDDYIVPLMAASVPDFSELAQALAYLTVILLAGVICSYAYNRIMVNVTQGTLRNVRIKMFTHMEHLPIRYFDTRAHGNIMSIYTNDVDTLRQVISQSVPQVINSGITIVSTLVSMLVLNVPLTIVSLAMVALMMLVTKKMGGMAGKYFIQQQKDIGSLNGYIEEMLEGQKVVKIFCHEEKAKEQFNLLNEQLRNSANNAHKVANIIMPINANLGNISYVLCAVVGALLALSGYADLTLGTLITFLGLNKGFNGPVSHISQQINSVVMAAAGANRVFELLDEQPEVDQGSVELVNAKENADGSLTETKERTGMWAWKHTNAEDGTVSYIKQRGEVTFNEVNFGYTEEKRVLHAINMYAKPGQKIAFVGSTGAGKTTITNLISRFYDIQEGRIQYDGIDIEQIKKDDLRHSLGIVLQDTNLFTGTVLENIRYGRLEATDEECIAAAKLANAHDFIRLLPDGYQTLLTGGGANLSQGQRQLLSIARVAVADPPVLILDEATSSIDTRTEILVQQGMDALMKGRTTFVIAHRLSTVHNSDCIMVMEHGKIIERGTHDELIEQQGKYYQLYTGNNLSA
ncbi:MAG: ABC transporter ATP-binding protein [Peptococcaceae bacterium]|nr:ABC transporter ATP-binding protein [Peptococcaceae bacterium]